MQRLDKRYLEEFVIFIAGCLYTVYGLSVVTPIILCPCLFTYNARGISNCLIMFLPNIIKSIPSTSRLIARVIFIILKWIKK